MKEIVLIGFFSEAIELCEKANYSIIGYVDQEKQQTELTYLGDDFSFIQNKEKYLKYNLFLVPDSPVLRMKLYTLYHDNGFKFETVVSPDAIVSKSACIDEGCMIQAGCNISSDVVLRKCVRINSMANIMHDTMVNDFSVVAPSAVLLGRVSVGSCSYIGANATVLPGIQIKKNCMVGAGAVVTKNIEESITVVGIPAKKLIKE